MATQSQSDPLEAAPPPQLLPHPAASEASPATAWPQLPLLPCLKHFSDLFFNLNDAISHHTPMKHFVSFAKSSTIGNDTLKFPNELQLGNSSAEAGMENLDLLNNIFNSRWSHETSNNFS